MSFDLTESSREDALPVTLYLFEIGTTRFGRTDAEESIVHNSVTYTPAPIKYGRIVASTGSDRRRVDVQMHYKDAFARIFFGPHPVFWAISLTIMEGHIGEVDYIERFKGVMSSASFVKDVFTASFETPQNEAARPGLRRTYQKTCPHILYGASCQVPRSNFSNTATVTAVSGSSVTLAPGWEGTLPKDQYLYGELIWSMQHGTARASILAVDSANDILSLSLVPEGLTVGATPTVAAGCNKHYDTCRDVFGNINNFGGVITEPIRNNLPFGTGD